MWEPNLEDANRWHNAHDYYEEEPTTCRECPELEQFDWAGEYVGICKQFCDEYCNKYNGGLLTLSAINASGIEDVDAECPFKGVHP